MARDDRLAYHRRVSKVNGSSDERRALLERLEAEAAEEARLGDLAADGDERGDAHHHPAEAATDADQRERQLRSQLRLREQQERLRRAQEALAAGTYGLCVDCGEPIPDARLRMVPDAIRCVSCQGASSRRRG